MLRGGNAGSNTAEDHIAAGRQALDQIPAHLHKHVLIRADSGGGTYDFLDWVTARRLQYSIGFTLTEEICDAIEKIPLRAWSPAWDDEGEPHDGAWVIEITGMLDLSTWLKGLRVIVRTERPHPGAQVRFTDIDGHRFTCFVTASRGRRLAKLELRHRHRARCEDRIRARTFRSSAPSLAFALISGARHSRPHPSRAGPLTTPQASGHATDHTVAALTGL